MQKTSKMLLEHLLMLLVDYLNYRDDAANTFDIGVVGINLDKVTDVTATASEVNLVDGSSAGTIVNSKAVIYGSAGEVNATTLQIGGTSITSDATEINTLDGVTGGTVSAIKRLL